MLVASPGFSSPPTLTLPPLGGGNYKEPNRWGEGITGNRTAGGRNDREPNRWREESDRSEHGNITLKRHQHSVSDTMRAL